MPTAEPLNLCPAPHSTGDAFISPGLGLFWGPVLGQEGLQALEIVGFKGCSTYGVRGHAVQELLPMLWAMV